MLYCYNSYNILNPTYYMFYASFLHKSSCLENCHRRMELLETMLAWQDDTSACWRTFCGRVPTKSKNTCSTGTTYLRYRRSWTSYAEFGHAFAADDQTFRSIAQWCCKTEYATALFFVYQMPERPTPMAARSNAWSCGCQLAEIVGLNSTWSMDVCFECCVLSGRGLCDRLITHPEEFYRVWCEQRFLRCRTH